MSDTEKAIEYLEIILERLKSGDYLPLEFSCVIEHDEQSGDFAVAHVPTGMITYTIEVQDTRVLSSCGVVENE